MSGTLCLEFQLQPNSINRYYPAGQRLNYSLWLDKEVFTKRMTEAMPINDSTLIIKPPYFTSFEQKAGKCGMNSAAEIVCLMCIEVL